MKQFSRFLLALMLTGLLATSALAQMTAREFDRIDHGKITKNQAEHLVLKKFPRASIKKCELRSGKEHSVWAVELVEAGQKSVTKLQVDGRSGKILP